MIEHGQGYEDSGRPMIVIAEVWPVAADELGLWLLSGDGPRPSLPVMDDSEPFDYAEMELMQAGMWATTKVLHSTSWRVDRGDLIVTYLAVVECEGLVRSRWPDALPISVKVADAVGQPPHPCRRRAANGALHRRAPPCPTPPALPDRSVLDRVRRPHRGRAGRDLAAAPDDVRASHRPHVQPGAPAPVPTDWSRAERLRTTGAWDELQAALVVGASFSHHAPGGGIWPDGAGMPDPSGKRPTNQAGTRAEPTR